MKALTAAEIREVDHLTTERFGVPSLTLMETAGRKAADAVWRVVAGRDQVRVCVLCGKGNNGGDGFVIARFLREAKVTPRVFLFGKPEEVRGDAAVNLSRWLDAGEIHGSVAANFLRLDAGGRLEVVASDADWE